MAILDLATGRPPPSSSSIPPGFGAQISSISAQRFGLTAGETRVLAEGIAGNGLPAAAARHSSITEATVRTHTYRILEENRNQPSDRLIRRFFETALPGSPGGGA